MILSKVYEDAENRLERNEITLGEFERLVNIEVIEPKCGEWIYTMNPLRLNDEWECSKCGYLSFAKVNYCGHCGCRMKGADDE